jgi:hypothetical protein
MFDLATAKTRLTITGTAQDALVQAALDAALDTVERYLNRKLMYAAEVASYYYTEGETLFLDRYPVEQVVSISQTSGGAAISKYKLHKSFGTILFPGRVGSDQIDVSYAGGYRVLPADLEMALWSIFDGFWPTISGASGSSVAAGAIESITIPDVGTVRYNVSGGASSGAAASGSGSPIYGAFYDILRLYRRELC